MQTTSFVAPPAKDPVQTLVEEIEREQRRESRRSLAIQCESNAEATAVAESLKSRGFSTFVSGYGKGRSVDVRCEPQAVTEMVKAALASRGQCSVPNTRATNYPTNDPLSTNGYFQPRSGLDAMSEDVAKIRKAMEKLQLTIDYEYTREGKLVLTLGSAKITLDRDVVSDEDLAAIDDMDRHVELTERLLRVLD